MRAWLNRHPNYLWLAVAGMLILALSAASEQRWWAMYSHLALAGLGALLWLFKRKPHA